MFQGYLLDVRKQLAWNANDLIRDISGVKSLKGKPKIFLFLTITREWGLAKRNCATNDRVYGVLLQMWMSVCVRVSECA